MPELSHIRRRSRASCTSADLMACFPHPASMILLPMRQYLRSLAGSRPPSRYGWLFVGGALVLPVSAESPRWQNQGGVEWAFGPKETDPTNHLLYLRCKPGIQYQLETSPDLVQWTTKQNVYGAGQIWTRSLFSTPKPPEEGEQPQDPPSAEEEQINEATLVIYAREGEGVWFTWRSLDDGSARARLLSGATLNPEWPPVFTGLSGDHQITLMRGGSSNSPNGPEVTTPLAEKDTSMWAAVQSGWAAFQTQVAEGASTTTSTPAQAATGSGFWRIRPLTVDTDHDGLTDDLELSTYHTNPFSLDSDGDSISDGDEILAGTNPNGHATTTDSDGDGIWDDQDADPGDKAVAWFRVPESLYGIIELGAPSGVSYADYWEYRLGESGHVLISRNSEDQWPGFSQGISAVGFPGPEYFRSHVWQPTTGTWSGPLSLPGNLRGVGSAIDSEGNVYGSGVGALGSNQTWPGIKKVPLRWKKTANTWSAAEVDSPGDDEVGSAFSNEMGTAASRGDSVIGPILFGGSNRIVSHSVNYLTSYFHTEVYRIGAGDMSPIMSIHTQDLSASPPVTTSCHLIRAAGEATGWHAYAWGIESINPDTFEPGPYQRYSKLCRLMPAVTNGQGETIVPASIVEANPPEGEARWNLSGLAGIHSNRLPSDVSASVVWSVPDNVHVGICHVGGNSMTWTASTRANLEQRIGGKINARGEALLGSRLWRNGRWIELSTLLPEGSGWTDIQGLGLNNSGMILLRGTVNGQRKLALLPPL